MKHLSKDEILLDIITPVVLIVLTILSIVIPIYLSNSNTLVRVPMQCTNIFYEQVINPDTGLPEDKENRVTLVGYSLKDLSSLNTFKHVNHYPNQYIAPSNNVEKNYKTQGNHEEIDQLSLDTKGTLQFVIYNYNHSEYDNLNKNVFEDSLDKTSKIKLYIPFAFDSASVWVDDTYFGTYGNMQNYDEKAYAKQPDKLKVINYDRKPIQLNLTFPYEPTRLMDNRIDNAKVVTIHYQSARGISFANDMPIVGAVDAVQSAINDKSTITIAFISVMIALIVGFLGMLYLKMSKENLPFLGIVLSALLLLISQLTAMYMSVGVAKTLSLASVSILIFFAMLSCKPKEKHLINVWKELSCISLINIVIMMILCVSVHYEFVLLYSRISMTVLCIIGCLSAIMSISTMSSVQCIGILISLISPLILMYTDYSLLSFMHPACLTLSISSLIILWHIFSELSNLEIKNKMLTKNLKAEVDTQTQNLKSALKDRETLISFISHDLRKASISIDVLTNDMLALEPSQREVQLTEQIKTKNSVVLTSLGEISTFMKRNFSDEEFTACKVKDIFGIIEKTIKPDCEANGIDFKIDCDKYSVRCKKRALISVISNLVFNAIEHADCKHITLSSAKDKDRIVLSVHDDGKGIENENVFSPYVTSKDKESNMGLGLFIVKTETEAQGGTISYHKENGSTFNISLLRDYE